jgi:hypothetical protein
MIWGEFMSVVKSKNIFPVLAAGLAVAFFAIPFQNKPVFAQEEGARGTFEQGRDHREGAGGREGLGEGRREGMRGANRANAAALLEARIPDLSEDQKTHILAIYAAAEAEMRAARENKSLSGEQRQVMISRVQGDLGRRIEPVLTEAQRVQWKQTENSESGGLGGAFRGGPNAGGPNAGGPGGQPPMNPAARTLRRYEQVLTDLSEEQKAQIIALSDESNVAMEGVRGNQELTEEQREAELARIREATGAKALLVFTDAQRAKWEGVLEARRQAELAKEFNLRPGETLEQKHERVMKPYVTVLPDLTAEQKAQLLPIAEGTSDVLDEVKSDAARSQAQKSSIEKRVQAATNRKLAAVLTKAQLEKWLNAQTPAKPSATKPVGTKPVVTKTVVGKSAVNKPSAKTGAAKTAPKN